MTIMRRGRRRGLGRGHGALRSGLRWLVALAALGSALPAIGGVQTAFRHVFPYENSTQQLVSMVRDEEAPNATTPTLPNGGSPSTRRPGTLSRQQHGTYAPTMVVRWNTFTILSGFGLEAGGQLELEVRNLTVLGFPPAVSTPEVPVVFTLYDLEHWRAYSVLQLREMPLKTPTVLCHYPSAMRYTLTERAFRGLRENNATTIRFTVPRPSLYTLQVQVCGDATVLVAGRAAMVNVGYDNQLSEHLGVQELGLIPVYNVVVIIYLILSNLWMLESFVYRRTVARIGFAFQVTLGIKTFESFIKVWYYRDLSQRGERDSLLKIFQDITESTSNAVFLWVMLLAALGWSLTRDELTSRERRLMVPCFMIYFLVALVKATCQADDELCKAYLLTEYIIKSVMMLGVIVALNFTINQLRLALTESRWNCVVTPLLYMKLNQFHSFRVVFLIYLLIPTTLLVLNLVVITPPGSWRYDWVNYLLGELTTLIIYVYVGIILRPLDSYEFMTISRGTDSGSAARPGDATALSVPPAGNVVVPELNLPESRAADSVPHRDQVIESNRRLLQEYGHSSSSPQSSPPASSPRGPNLGNPGLQVNQRADAV